MKKVTIRWIEHGFQQGEFDKVSTDDVTALATAVGTEMVVQFNYRYNNKNRTAYLHMAHVRMIVVEDA